jgi:hypothetical protein
MFSTHVREPTPDPSEICALDALLYPTLLHSTPRHSHSIILNAIAANRSIFQKSAASVPPAPGLQKDRQVLCRRPTQACDGKPALAVTSPAGKHFMPGDAELERIGIRIVVYPQDILAASVRAMRDALAGLKGGSKPPMASPAELATAIRIAEYLSQDSRWPDPS